MLESEPKIAREPKRRPNIPMDRDCVEYLFSVMVGMSRRAVPARVVAGGKNIQVTLAFEGVAPLHAARTSQRDVPTTLNTYETSLSQYQVRQYWGGAEKPPPTQPARDLPGNDRQHAARHRETGGRHRRTFSCAGRGRGGVARRFVQLGHCLARTGGGGRTGGRRPSLRPRQSGT